MDGLDWVFVAAAAFFYLFFTGWIVDAVVRSVFRRIDRKSGSLALEPPEHGPEVPVDPPLSEG